MPEVAAAAAVASRLIRPAGGDSGERKGHNGKERSEWGRGLKGGVGLAKRTRKDVPIGNCNCKSISFPRVLT